MVLSRGSSWLLAGAAALGLFWSSRWALAEFYGGRRTLASTFRAAALAPGNATFALLLAELDPERQEQHLHAALRGNPAQTEARIQLSLLYEQQGRLVAAGRELQVARQHDRTYEAEWAQANFFFRQRQTAACWPALAACARYSQHNLTPVLALAAALSADFTEVWQRLELAPTEAVLRPWVAFLTARGALVAAFPGAVQLARLRPVEAKEAWAYQNALVDQQESKLAAPYWRVLQEANVNPYPAVLAERVSNGDFSHAPLPTNLDWRVEEGADPQILLPDGPAGARFHFRGQEPEQVDLLRQALLLLPGRTYRLRTRQRSDTLRTWLGLRWQLIDPRTRRPVIDDLVYTAHDQEQSWTFTAPAEPAIPVLVLRYQRTLGTTRLNGDWLLERVSLTLIP